MTDRQFVRIRRSTSWHAILTPTRAIDGYRTLCGRLIVSREISDTLPGDERTCERCLVSAVKRDDPS